jgi:hypothetical protein
MGDITARLGGCGTAHESPRWRIFQTMDSGPIGLQPERRNDKVIS